MNPEFQRNLWLELSPVRLVLMPTLILLSAITIFSLAPNSNSALGTLLSLSLYGFIVVTAIWGFAQAGSSLSQEFIEGTWDSQRMSALTPWQMLWGKVGGGTIYAWYGGVMLLAIAGGCAFMLGHSPAKILVRGVMLVCLALLLHSLALLAVLLASRKSPGGKSLISIGALALVIVLVVIAFRFASESLSASLNAPALFWWRQDWNPLNFTAASLAFLTLWGLIGLWETMRRELMLHNRVWWWPLFLLFWLAWAAGFIQGQEKWYLFFTTSAGLIGLSGYLLLFIARKDQGVWLRLMAAKQNKQLLHHLEPSWLISFVIAIGLGIVAVVLSTNTRPSLIFFLCCCAFAVRDIAWILWLNLVIDASRRAEGAALVSLVVAYGLLPLLFKFATDQPFFMPPFSSVHTASALTALISALTQAALCLGLFYRRWRLLFRQP